VGEQQKRRKTRIKKERKEREERKEKKKLLLSPPLSFQLSLFFTRASP
jgi:hypothetical protein